MLAMLLPEMMSRGEDGRRTGRVVGESFAAAHPTDHGRLLGGFPACSPCAAPLWCNSPVRCRHGKP
jgi:hypothetical protein